MHTLTHLAKNFLVVVAAKRGTTGKHDVENNTNRPHVTLACVTTLKHLRRDVVRGTVHLTHLGAIITEHVRGAKIDDFNLAFLLGVNKNVLRL